MKNISLAFKKYTWPFLGSLMLLTGVLSLSLAMGGSSSGALSSSGKNLDLIKGQDWSHMAGATQTSSNTVDVQPLGRAIVNQDGSDNQDNPPVNARGPHLSFTDSINVDFKATNIPQNGTASIYMYSSVPIIYDEWRYQPAQLRIDLSQQSVSLYEWSGHSDKPYLYKTWNFAVGSSAYVSTAVRKGEKTIVLSVNGRQLDNIKGKKLFNGGNIWFGADASINAQSWTLKSLSANAANSKLSIVKPQSVNVVSDNSQTLRNLSHNSTRGLPIGAAITSSALFSDTQYKNLVGSQINLLVPENELKPQFVHPQPDIYSFSEADSLVEFAKANDMTVHGHTLEFSEANPKWMQKSALADRQNILTSHIKTVVSHFGNNISSWDVVDEPLNDNDRNRGDSRDLRRNIWFAAMGENYIDESFKAARSANPSAKLYINEYGLEADGPRWDEFVSLAKRLKARNVPIDGVGFQSHIYEPGDEIDSSILRKHMLVLAQMGLSSRISELDAYGDNEQHQASQYAAVLDACLRSPTCTSFTMWGLTDRYGSTTEAHAYPLSYGNDLLWDEFIHAKPAFTRLQNELKNQSH